MKKRDLNNPRKLNAKQTNRLAIEQQLIKIKLIENALSYVGPAGQSTLFGLPIDSGHLVRAKETLKELDRLRGIYESEAYGKKQLPYLPGNGSTLDKIKAHFDEKDGELLFFEIKSSSGGRTVVEHVQTKSHIKKSIKTKLMAVKKKAAKKAPAKKAAKKSVKKTQGDSIKSYVEKFVGQGKDNAAIFEALNKIGIVYSEKSVRWYASKARQK